MTRPYKACRLNLWNLPWQKNFFQPLCYAPSKTSVSPGRGKTGKTAFGGITVIIRKKEVKLQAYCLGAGHPVEEALRQQGLIHRAPDGSYRLFSQETRGSGQQAKAGDYFKVDSSGSPYPNDRAFFLENHVHLEGDWYLQQARPMRAWCDREGMCEELRFILDRGLLTVDETSAENHFSAELWGTRLYAARDAIIVFSQVERDDGGRVRHVEFYFLAREVFLETYDVLEDAAP